MKHESTKWNTTTDKKWKKLYSLYRIKLPLFFDFYEMGSIRQIKKKKIFSFTTLRLNTIFLFEIFLSLYKLVIFSDRFLSLKLHSLFINCSFCENMNKMARTQSRSIFRILKFFYANFWRPMFYYVSNKFYSRTNKQNIESAQFNNFIKYILLFWTTIKYANMESEQSEFLPFSSQPHINPSNLKIKISTGIGNGIFRIFATFQRSTMNRYNWRALSW